jgi:hypothetical protein
MSGSAGGMDIRLPIGLMFSIIGAIITVFGAMTNGDAMYDKHSLGININLWWGLVLLAFGAIMLLMAFMGDKNKTP